MIVMRKHLRSFCEDCSSFQGETFTNHKISQDGSTINEVILTCKNAAFCARLNGYLRERLNKDSAEQAKRR